MGGMDTSTDYREFINSKSQHGLDSGFEPYWIPDWLFDYQDYLDNWAIRKGRCELLADTGLGKTLMELVWAQNVIEHTNKPCIISTPLAVGQQILEHADKFGIKAKRTRDGVMTDEPIVWITNYQQLHKYDPSKFSGFCGDEAGCLKDEKSATKKLVREFTRNMPYRLLATATAAPNDYQELGNASEVLGYLGYQDMLSMFFKQMDSGGRRWGGMEGAKYRFRGHAEQPFWSWVCSWARSIRKPSDLGFDDDRFILPELIEREVIVESAKARPGHLFPTAANGLAEERTERRNSLNERCEQAAQIAIEHPGSTILWCDLNDEGDLIEKLIPGCVQVKGNMPDDKKEEYLIGFARGEIKNLVLKKVIGAWGLNLQTCHNVVSFPTHSAEQDYQLVRRCWRFGQKNPVSVTRILCEGERHIMDNMKRKYMQMDRMFDSINRHMKDALHLVSADHFPLKEELPQWLSSTKS